MVGMVVGEATGTWLERARAEDALISRASAGSGSTADPLSGIMLASWDPYDVWLHHIDEPRRLRDTQRQAP